MKDSFNKVLTYLAGIFGCFLMLSLVLADEEKINLLVKLVFNKIWIINSLIILSFFIFVHISFIINNEDTKHKNKLKDAVNKAMIAFIIAVFASLDMTIIPFWFVFSFAYNTELI